MNRPNRLKPALMACAAGLSLLAAQPAFAQTVDSAKLLELMVAKGLVTREEADGLLAQATVAPTPAPVPAGGVANGVQTIPYIPQVVRDQIKEELRAELGTQAQAQGWSAPGQTPEWTRGITLSGDIRVRGEGVFMDDNNADIFVDYGAINGGPGQNIGLDVHHHDMAAVLRRQQGMADACGGVARGLDHHVQPVCADQRVAVIGYAGAAGCQRLGQAAGGGGVHIPAGGGKCVSGARHRQIGDAHQVHARNMAHLRQKHRAELTRAD